MARLGGRVQRQGRLSVTKMGKLPASCTRHNLGGKRLSAAIDDDANSWEVHAVACKRMRLGPWPPDRHPCGFCVKSFHSAQALGGHMHVHKNERMALKARLRADARASAAAALAATKARQIQLCNETAAAAASSTPKIFVSSPVQATTTTTSRSPVAVAAVGAMEILRPPALSNYDSSMAGLMSLLGLTPEELSTTTKFIPPPPPLLKLPLPELATTNAFIPPPVLNLRLIPPAQSSLPLPQSKSSPVVLKHPHSVSTQQQSSDFPLWQKKSNFPLPPQLRKRSSLVMSSPPVSISSSAQRTFHPYQRELVQLGRFSVMASAPLDLELRLGCSSGN